MATSEHQQATKNRAVSLAQQGQRSERDHAEHRESSTRASAVQAFVTLFANAAAKQQLPVDQAMLVEQVREDGTTVWFITRRDAVARE